MLGSTLFRRPTCSRLSYSRDLKSHQTDQHGADCEIDQQNRTEELLQIFRKPNRFDVIN